MNPEIPFLIIPVYNERPDILLEVISAFSHYNCILVDDGSSNNVFGALSKKPDPEKIKLVRLDKNYGQGEAIYQGVKHALGLGATTFCTVDGDGQHDPQSIDRIIKAFQESSKDIFLGSRFLGNNKGIPFSRKLFLKGGIFINYLYAGIMLHDAHCGIRVFNKKFAEKMHFYNKRQAHASEFLFLIKENNFSFEEYPVNILYTPYSIGKGQSVWNSFKILYDLIRHRIYLIKTKKGK